MVATARLAADSVTLGYDEQTIVSDVSLAIPDGQITTIIGPNGCGKSTLLRSLVRLKAPDSGTVILDGQAIQHFPTKEVAKRLGLLAQQATAPGGVTVEDLVMRGRFPHQSFLQPPNQQDRDAVDRALDLTNMIGMRTRPVDQLSGGQRQRAWIAMVLAQETPILLLDEPTTYLDIAHQLQIVELVRHLNETDGRTIVLVLHDINEAIRISHNIVAMKDGQILAQGSPASIITSELIGEIYGAECDVLLAPGQAKPFCIPRGRHAASPESRAAAAAVFEVDGLRTSYGKINVLHGLTCHMPAGAITGIVGPNACGKSTLLRSCGRLLRPTEGQVRLAGRDVNRGKHKELSRNLSLMAQSPTMPSGFQVEDLVALGRAPHQGFFRQWREEDEEAVETALNHCNLCELRRRSIETLSGGQRQRAWFGMTLAQDTPVLLLDEPTTFLDLAAQIEMLDLVREMNQAQQRSVVMVLHDLNLAARYCDYLIVMKDGQIVTSGTPRAVVTEEMLADVFGIEATVMPDPANGMPLVIPHQAIEELHTSTLDSNNG
ncbi:MAG: ABC transporter ATP-binding protein [Thermomicrobiales bacterium]|jgi:iron complex transport system ATP-binding protein|nr:ABC transporter ATP-binding protein [Thermomicrobiales bacterium]